MKITFCLLDKYWGGLASNGGSRTILLSQKTLIDMGHKTRVVAQKDRFKWFDHPKIKKTIPESTDVAIAVSISDVVHLMKQWKGKMAYWARPVETWQYEEKRCCDVLKEFTRKGGKIFCNSSWQVMELKHWGIKSELQFSGLDIAEWSDKKIRDEMRYKVVGCQYSVKKRKNYKEYEKLIDLVGDEGMEYDALGSKKKFESNKLMQYLSNPNHYLLNKFYSSLHIFFAPNLLEGFYNCAAEAALCGALVVCNNVYRNGMMDYANKDTAMIYKNINEAVDAIKNPDYSKVEKMQNVLKTKIGDRNKNMKEFVEKLCL